MDQVDESRRAEVSGTCGDCLRQMPYLLRYEILDGSVLRRKMLHEVLTDAVVTGFGQHTVDLLIHYLAITQRHSQVNVTHHHAVARRVHHQYGVARHVLHLLAFAGMVVPHKYDVEPRHIACYVQRSVLPIFAAHQQSVLSGMEHTHYNIRAFLLTNYLHPLARRCFHIVKAQAFPQVFGQPHRDSGCYHAENHNLYTVAFKRHVGREMILTRSRINDVGSQHRGVAIACPTIENGTSGLHIVVAHIAGIIAHVVQHFGRQMRRHSINVVVVISRRLPLQNITVVQQNQVVFIRLALFLHKSIYTRQTPGGILLQNKIMGIVVPMYVTGLYYLQLNDLLLCRNRSEQQEKPYKATNSSLHTLIFFFYQSSGWVKRKRAPCV